MKIDRGMGIFLLLSAVIVFISGCYSDSAPRYGAMFQQVVQQAGNKVFPALVYIKVVQENMNSGRSSSSSASGSGVIISAAGAVNSFISYTRSAERRNILAYGAFIISKFQVCRNHVFVRAD